MISSSDIRTTFLNYFRDREHEILPSSSLIPSNDPTLLFTNSGMVQFKEALLGLENPPYTKAATSQRCVRAGGKHNDLENVGHTTRHHTFFEMLGNFSFGDYFKHQAMAYAWDFLTKELNIQESRLHVTVFEEDDETEAIWINDIGVPPQHLSRCSKDDNFWQMGDTGPCGPCTEIFYDHGEQMDSKTPQGIQTERYVEIWNLVFTQYNRATDGTLTPLPRPAVDTGMGLERITAIMQGVHDNYDTDIFTALIARISTLPGIHTSETISLRVIADHIRCCAFMIADGVLPDNDGRGYVMRRIIRRAIRHGHKAGLTEPFLHKLVEPLQQLMAEAYPELAQQQQLIRQTLLDEEQRFTETLEHGLRHLKSVIKTLQGQRIPGADIFKLYDTYGFPVDLTADIASEHGLQIDHTGFKTAMSEQRNRARSSNQFNLESATLATGLETQFNGYDLTQQAAESPSTILAIYQGGKPIDILPAGNTADIILDKTPFYAEAGGQVGDTGTLSAAATLFKVQDTKKQGQAHIHKGVLQEGELKIGQQLHCQIDKDRRQRIACNHSATHLLHAALKKVLGPHVTQKGSLVNADKLRFDFSHKEPIPVEQLMRIEALVNTHIFINEKTGVETMSLAEAKDSGAISLFGEKYGDIVSVLSIGGKFSKELCSGTHVDRAGAIGLIKITSGTGIATGIRRLEAITGVDALNWIQQGEKQLHDVAKLLKTDRQAILSCVEKNLAETKKLEQQLSTLQKKQIGNISSDIATEAEEISGIQVIAKVLEGADAKTLRDTIDCLKNKLGTATLIFATVENDKITLVAGVTKDITKTINATELINFVAHQVGGKGGGRADMAQAGGNNPAALNSALASVTGWISKKMQS